VSFQKVLQLAAFVSFAPSGLPLFPHFTQACAVGCILSPLRGWGARILNGLPSTYDRLLAKLTADSEGFKLIANG
jgi:hypothetical protein